MHHGNILNSLYRSRGLSQEKLAESLSVSRSTIQNWILKPELTEDQINKISEFFKVDKRIFNLESYTEEDAAEYLVKNIANQNDQSNVELVTAKVPRIKVPVIPLDATASFLETINGGFRINDLELEVETIERIPGIKYSPLSVIFKVAGNSMYPRYIHTSKWLCTWVDASNWQYLEGVHVISTKSGSLLLKRVTKKTNGTFYLKSDNPDYGDRMVESTEVLAVWKVQYCIYAPAE